MRAVGVIHYGGPEALEQIELPIPEAGPGQVRIRVQAAAVNPADVQLRDGSLAKRQAGQEPPFIPGMDVAGTIDQVGSDVEELHQDQQVVAIVDNHGQLGGYSEYVVLPAESVTASPAGTSPVEAATFLMPALTARMALDLLAPPAGSTLLVTGAAGGVGRYAVALARAEGHRVVALARAADEETVRGLGAEVFVARSEDSAALVRGAVPHGVDAVLDAAALHERIVAAVRDGGRLATLRGWRGEPSNSITVIPVRVRNHATDHAAIIRLREQVEEGLLPLDVAATYPAANAVEAHRAFEAGHVRGRIILTFD